MGGVGLVSDDGAGVFAFAWDAADGGAVDSGSRAWRCDCSCEGRDGQDDGHGDDDDDDDDGDASSSAFWDDFDDAKEVFSAAPPGSCPSSCSSCRCPCRGADAASDKGICGDEGAGEDEDESSSLVDEQDEERAEEPCCEPALPPDPMSVEVSDVGLG